MPCDIDQETMCCWTHGVDVDAEDCRAGNCCAARTDFSDRQNLGFDPCRAATGWERGAA